MHHPTHDEIGFDLDFDPVAAHQQLRLARLVLGNVYLLQRRALQVREDLRDDLGLLDTGDDLQPAAATVTAVDLDAKHALQPPRPVHRDVTGRRRLARGRSHAARRAGGVGRRPHRPPAGNGVRFISDDRPRQLPMTTRRCLAAGFAGLRCPDRPWPACHGSTSPASPSTSSSAASKIRGPKIRGQITIGKMCSDPCSVWASERIRQQVEVLAQRAAGVRALGRPRRDAPEK